MSAPHAVLAPGEALPVLTRTPALLDLWLRDLPEPWLATTEGPDTFSPRDVVGHLVHGEDTDWIPRARRILDHGETVPFDPFDRVAHRERFRGLPIGDLLDQFASRRAASLDTLAGWKLTATDLERRGTHPLLGPVTLGQLLATWVAHDLDHVGQIARVMAKRYREDVGPWTATIRILSDREPH